MALTLRFSAKDLQVNLLVAASYALLGVLALQIAVLPGFGSPIYPPAGIALAALLVYGPRCLPGIFLGSLMTHMAANVIAGDAVPLWALATIISITSLQGLVGREIFRRLIGYPNPLSSPTQILRFLFVVAPLGCLPAATIAIPALTSSGAASASGALFAWWSWWLGDTLGVIIFTPLVLVFFGAPSDDWRRRKLTVAVPMVVGLLLLTLLFWQLLDRDTQRVRTAFAHDAETIGTLVSTRLQAHQEMLTSAQRLMSITDGLSADDWRAFTDSWLKRYPGALNLTWNPYVTRAGRSEYEDRMSAAHGPGFRIKNRDATGRVFPAPEADEYLPITYVEPIERNRIVVGMNPLSLPSLSATIEATRKTGLPYATPAIRLAQEQGNQRGVVTYFAVFDETVAGEPTNLKGIVTAALRMDEAVASAFDLNRFPDIELCLYDVFGEPGNRRLSGAEKCEEDNWLADYVSQKIPYRFANRDWILSLRASNAYVSRARSATVWVTLAVGLGVIAMLEAFLLVTTGRTRRIEEQVAIRTAELSDATRLLEEQKAALALAQRVAQIGSWEIIGAGPEIRCSAEFRRIFGFDNAQAIVLNTVCDRLETKSAERFVSAISAAKAAPGLITLDVDLQSPEPEQVLTLHVQIENQWQEGLKARIHGTVQNVTEARRAEEHIHLLARYDSLTGLPNRTHWLDKARTAIAGADRHNDQAAVLFLDLDNFKTVNDSLGHPIGDKLLSLVAARLKQCTRADDLIARIGGDEFVLLLPRLHRPDEASIVAEKLIRSLTLPITVDQHELSASVSIGISTYPADGNDLDTLLKHADVAMYSAKQAGRNTFQYFIPEMNARATTRLKLEGALRKAIERNELVLHYQPQLDISKGIIDSCEALVRWMHPEQGMVPPGLFIPLAEESGLIVPLGDWVLAEACRQQVEWAASGLDVTVAVNVSALQFQQTGYANKVADILRSSGADPHRIELEITESALVNPTGDLIERLDAIRSSGITLALDDFGTGYSSLAYLKRLPIQRLKLDRSFVQDLPNDADDAAIASAALSMARDLGLDVVAEGVETIAQRDFLAARGCRFIQGYLVAKPQVAERIGPWLRQFPQ